jgi:hypothetical protein
VKAAIAIAGIVLAGVGALALRVVLEGRAALAEGDAASARQHHADAIAAWESAARWYLPGAPHVDQAYARLVVSARSNRPHALAAWQAVRRAALATESVWTPHSEDLAAANAALARARAIDPDGATAAGADPAAREAWYAAGLARPVRPSTPAVVLAIGGILCWLAGITLVVRRGFDAAGRVVRRPAVVGIAVTLVGIAGWAAGLYNA